LIDAVLAGGAKSGYGFASTGQIPVGGANTVFTAAYQLPTTRREHRAFCAFEDGVLRQLPPVNTNPGGAAAAVRWSRLSSPWVTGSYCSRLSQAITWGRANARVS
jgi:hypothetical protein